jgi:tRNA(fMet)-specific endonuclease VapC
MGTAYLLDTNTVSYLIANQPPQVRQRLQSAGAEVTAISTITEAELRYGAARTPGALRRRTSIELFLAGATILPWDSDAARAYAELRTEQERKGRPLSVEDLMIAAHALSHGLILVTSDHAFSFVQGLRREDWTAA